MAHHIPAVEFVKRMLRLGDEFEYPPGAPPLEAAMRPIVEICPNRKCTSMSWESRETKRKGIKLRCVRCNSNWPSHRVYGRGSRNGPGEAQRDELADMVHLFESALEVTERRVMVAWLQTPNGEKHTKRVIKLLRVKHPMSEWEWRFVLDVFEYACARLERAMENPARVLKRAS